MSEKPDFSKMLSFLRKNHLELSNSKNRSVDVTNMPIVVYQGFSVHGDEPSGTNASLPLIYHLLASNSDETKELLNDVVILLDPSLNPDGLQRFSQWANSNKNQSLNPDSNDRHLAPIYVLVKAPINIVQNGNKNNNQNKQ